MRKSTLLKLALVFSALIMFAGANAQILTNYSEDEATQMYQTVNTTFRLYTLPDPVYSPSYVAATNANLGADAQWRFVISAGLTPTAPVVSNTPIAQNWVELTSAATGTYTVAVTELNTLVGCEDASARTTTINVIAVPTAAISGAGANNTWNVTTAGHDYDICGNAVAENITVAITETGAPATLTSYAYYVQKRVVNIDAAGVEAAASEVISAFIDHPIATKYDPATADGGSEVLTTGAMNVVSYDWDGAGPGVAVPSRTKYEFTLMKASDAAAASAQGIVSGISHKSDYVTIDNDVAGDGDLGASDEDITTYAFTGTVTVVYIVNPTPVTGPVYHIPNNFNL